MNSSANIKKIVPDCLYFVVSEYMKMKTALIILAGGQGKRVGNKGNIPKQYIKIGNTNLIEYFVLISWMSAQFHF